jgi:hypothetical protein
MSEITEQSMIVVGTGRKRGRPRVEEPRSSVSTWVPSRLHDTLIDLAKKHDVSVSSMVRTMLVMQIRRG